jgi:hypothetical protein
VRLLVLAESDRELRGREAVRGLQRRLPGDGLVQPGAELMGGVTNRLGVQARDGHRVTSRVHGGSAFLEDRDEDCQVG